MENKQKNHFWWVQSLGWLAFGLFNGLVQTLVGLPMELVVGNSIGASLCGFVVTSIYRWWIKRQAWKKLPIGRLIGYVILTLPLLSVTWLGLIISLSSVLIPTDVDHNDIIGNLGFILILFFTWNVIYFAYQLFLRWHQVEIEKWQLIASVKEAQLGTLKAQLNPHFMFNALNNIRALINEDTERARDLITSFSDLLRYSLKNSDRELVTIGQEMEVVHQYLELSLLQYEERLRFEIEMDETLIKREIPMMCIQLLIENAIKHGIAILPEGGLVRLKIGVDKKEMLEIMVENPGHLNTSNQTESRLGIGLKNIRDRLQLLYDGKATFSLVGEQELVRARLCIPK